MVLSLRVRHQTCMAESRPLNTLTTELQGKWLASRSYRESLVMTIPRRNDVFNQKQLESVPLGQPNQISQNWFRVKCLIPVEHNLNVMARGKLWRSGFQPETENWATWRHVSYIFTQFTTLCINKVLLWIFHKFLQNVGFYSHAQMPFWLKRWCRNRRGCEEGDIHIVLFYKMWYSYTILPIFSVSGWLNKIPYQTQKGEFTVNGNKTRKLYAAWTHGTFNPLQYWVLLRTNIKLCLKSEITFKSRNDLMR